MPFYLPQTAKRLTKEYLFRLSSYTDNLPSSPLNSTPNLMYDFICDVINQIDVITYTKDDAKLAIKNYLIKISSYCDIRVHEVYKALCDDIIEYVIVPL